MRAIAITPLVDGDVFDVSSEMGGIFTVSIIQDFGNGSVLVRILYGEITDDGWKSFGLFDGKTFCINRERLTNRRPLR
ncbi:hypothetical protein [Agrobacterium tumefaciens]|uniref:hypothetical protein n=1 Tax=Agrobacterium tumefaciens TaxID=358 RepID=UPI001CBDD624|nr:hypothetical protein [Agrobacterium tumefaciens]